MIRSLTGTLDFTNNSTTITGTSTSFTSEVKVGDFVKKTSDGETNYVQVAEVISDTEMSLETAYQGTTSSSAENNRRMG